MATNILDADGVGNRPAVATPEEPRLKRGVLADAAAARAKNREYLFYAITKNGGFIAALVWIFTQPSGWVEWSGFFLFYAVNILSMSLGYHRYFAHRAFETSVPMRYALGILAQFGVYGSLPKWVADHRRHHSLSDREGDIHSPHVDPHGRRLSGWRGIAFAQLGWVFHKTVTDWDIYGKGLMDDPVMRFCHRTRYFWYGVSALVLPALWGWAWGGTGAILGTIFIAGFLRVQVALHLIGAVNSFGHAFGSQRFKTNDTARNNWILGWLTLGEGWHHNHHAHPRSARAGLTWWEVDPTAWLIRLMEKMGLVWNVRYAPRYRRNPAGEWVALPGKAPS